MKLALDRIPSRTPTSAFRTTGLFSFNKFAVSALPGPDISSSNPQAENVPVVQEKDLCGECGHSNHNPLVRLGIIPSVLVEPSTITKSKTKMSRLLSARVITAMLVEDVNHETENQAQEPVIPDPEPLSKYEDQS